MTDRSGSPAGPARGWSRRDFLKTTAGLGVLAALGPAEFLAACGNGQSAAPTSEKVVKGGHITDTIPADIAGFNPVLVAEGPVQATPQSLLFVGLLTQMPNGDLIPRLAQAMPQVSSDGRTYTFKLRGGVKWTDGTPLTADDVVFTYTLTYEPQ